MAIFEENEIKNCGEPPDPEGPFQCECFYEYAAFMDCSSDGTYVSLKDPMGKDATGYIGTYTANGPSAQPYTNGRYDFAYGDIVGTPYSKPHFLGLVSTDWHDYFDKNRKYVDKEWWQDQPKNMFLYNYRYKLAKYIYLEEHWIDAEQLNQGWRCPDKPAGWPDVPARVPYTAKVDWERMFGPTPCPRYYKLTSCTDCMGQTDASLKDIYLEFKDKRQLNVKILEYKKNTENCYDVTALQFGPRNFKNYFTLDLKQEVGNADTYAEWDKCQECRDPWVLAISQEVDRNFWQGARPTWINSINNWTGTSMFQAVAAGRLSIVLMDKKNIMNQVFRARWGDEFFYKDSNGACRHAVFYDSAKGAVGNPPCSPTHLAYWAEIYADTGGAQAGTVRHHPNNPRYIDSSQFANVAIWKDACACSAAGLSISRHAQVECNKPEPRPSTIGPQNIEIDVTKKNPTKNVTFSASVKTNGTRCTYIWFKNGISVSQGTMDTDGQISYTFNAGHDDDGTTIYFTIQNKGNNLSSRTAMLKVNKEPECLFCGRDVITFSAKVFCIKTQADANKLRKTLSRTIRMPSSSTGTWRMYANPDTFPATAAEVSKINNKWWLKAGSFASCKGAYTMLKATNATIEKWEDVSADLKGIDPTSKDETIDSDRCIQVPGKTAKDAGTDFYVDMNIP